jgi:hypothetical protein
MRQPQQSFDGPVEIVLSDERFDARALLTGYVDHDDILTIGGLIPFDSNTSWSGLIVDLSQAVLRKMAIQKFEIKFSDGRVGEAIFREGIVEGIGPTPF